MGESDNSPSADVRPTPRTSAPAPESLTTESLTTETLTTGSQTTQPTAARNPRFRLPRGPRQPDRNQSRSPERRRVVRPLLASLPDRKVLLTEARDAATELSPVRQWRQVISSSPGRLFLIGVVLIVLAIGASLYGANTVDDRAAMLDSTITDTEPLSEASQILYSSLSIADATANSGFISGGVEPPALRARYLNAIATAEQALVQSGSFTTPVLRDDLTTIGQQLPMYSGLIETARTNNRLGNPVGTSYLGVASTLMQQTILPAAERLYTARTDAVDDSRSGFTRPPWGSYVMLALLLLGLVLAQIYLRRRSNRTLNLGFVVATGLAIVMTAWIVTAGLFSVTASSTADDEGAAPLRTLAQARILTQQARSDETLGLVRRGDETQFADSYVQTAKAIDALFTTYLRDNNSGVANGSVEEARAQLNGWRIAHDKMNELATQGNYAGATRLAVGTGADDTGGWYQRLDDSLVKGITTARDNFRNKLDDARISLNFAGLGLRILGVVTGIWIAIALFPRIREYR